MKRIASIRLVLLILSFLAFLQPTFAADPPLPTPVGRVVWIKGTFKAVMPSKEERLLQKMSVLYLHDTLITDDKTQAEIVFTDNSLMTFRENTTFVIDKYNFAPKQKKSVGSYVMRLIEGGFRTITGLVAKENPDNYQINTPVATIGVRGTDYAVYFRAGQLLIGQYAGQPCVKGNDPKNTKLCLDQDTRYGSVESGSSAPVPLYEQPIVFQQQLEIVPATISPFGTQSTPGTGRGGTVSSFCISQ